MPAMDSLSRGVTTPLMIWMLFTMLTAQVHGEGTLTTTIRANSCIVNTTHCHCAMVAANANSTCLKPVSGSENLCTKSGCASGYRCDCGSSAICVKKTVSSYKATESNQAETVQCTVESTTVPSEIVGQTSDFHIVAYQEFQLFVNDQQIGYGDSNVYKVLTAEISSGDVIAVVAKRRSEGVYGVKLRFVDVQDEIRVIDENWYASSTYEASWLDRGFDAEGRGWEKPVMASTVAEEGFDGKVSWMWLGTAETVYFRYVIP